MDQTTSRRGFLRLSGGAALAPAASAALGQFSALLAAVPPAGEDYWNMVRRQFAFTEAKVPMNAANLCPSPRVVAEHVAELTRDIDGDCSFQNRARLAGLLELSRAKAARQLGVTAEEIALVRNTSEANNAINSGLPLKAGDEVVLWDQNHPTNNVAWDVRAARFGLKVRRVRTPAAPEGAGQLVQTFTDALTSSTRVLALTHVSNVSGLKLPVKEICDEARRRGVYVHVDGAQSWGALEVDLRELGCDSYSASAHKWFVGPKEVGLLFVRKERIGEIWPSVVAPGWGSAVQPEVKGARKFESLGQRDDAALAAIATAADFHFAIGPARAAARVVELASLLKNGLKEAGLDLVTPLDPALSGGVCIVRVPADRREDVYQQLYAQHGIAGAATGGLRLCPHFYNTREHLERAVAGIKTLLAAG